jgi:hypothetical protein
MIRNAWLTFGSLAVLSVVACAREAPRGVTTAVSSASAASATTAGTATSTPPPQTSLASAADWTVVRREHVLEPERFRLTVILAGRERTLDASRLCYEATVPGQVLPETVPSSGGYDVDCHVGY